MVDKTRLEIGMNKTIKAIIFQLEWRKKLVYITIIACMILYLYIKAIILALYAKGSKISWCNTNRHLLDCIIRRMLPHLKVQCESSVCVSVSHLQRNFPYRLSTSFPLLYICWCYGPMSICCRWHLPRHGYPTEIQSYRDSSYNMHLH